MRCRSWLSLYKLASRELVHMRTIPNLCSATVCGGLPVLNVATRDLFGAEVTKVEGIFNSTTSYILGEMRKGEDTKTVCGTIRSAWSWQAGVRT